MEMMDMAADDTREELRRKLRSNFDGRIVRKDLTKKIKEGANVPVYVLEFKMDRGHMETKNAEIALVRIVHKITNLITSMDFIQSDAVSDTVKAAKYRIFFLSEDNEKISNENSYVADSREENAQKRIFRMRFTFKNKKYDKDKQYYLVVYDEESGLEQWRQPVIMDIAFADDFGFGF